MPPVVRPDDLISQLDDLTRRVRALETAPRLGNSSFRTTGGVDLPVEELLIDAPDATLIGPAESLNMVTTYTDFDRHDVTVGASGKLLVVLRARIICFTGGSCRMAYSLSGANTRAATDDDSCIVNSTNLLDVTGYVIALLTGLNPGETTITTAFKTGASNSAQFQDRYTFALPLQVAAPTGALEQGDPS